MEAPLRRVFSVASKRCDVVIVLIEDDVKRSRASTFARMCAAAVLTDAISGGSYRLPQIEYLDISYPWPVDIAERENGYVASVWDAVENTRYSCSRAVTFLICGHNPDVPAQGHDPVVEGSWFIPDDVAWIRAKIVRPLNEDAQRSYGAMSILGCSLVVDKYWPDALAHPLQGGFDVNLVHVDADVVRGRVFGAVGTLRTIDRLRQCGNCCLFYGWKRLPCSRRDCALPEYVTFPSVADIERAFPFSDSYDILGLSARSEYCYAGYHYIGIYSR